MNDFLNAIIRAVDDAWYAPGEISRLWDFNASAPQKHQRDGPRLESFIVQEIYESDGLSTNWVASAIGDLRAAQDAIEEVLSATESSNKSN